ncbi:hypothetical protein ElyMa_000515000 [Elysia marginata]|uniref:Uncharacterized protein n=1 Tax=Elysia marginata TaxID=1093978 RepID=A0AAV4FWS5_9GAST|nr:hypothetical protein ElyMa_000515000 [Elysia marginata]
MQGCSELEEAGNVGLTGETEDEDGEAAASIGTSSTSRKVSGPSKISKKEAQKQRRLFGKAYVGRHFDKESSKFVEVDKEPLFQSMADVYREYTRLCDVEAKPKMSRTVFVEELKAHNISIFVPRKDQCDLCTTYKRGNADEAAYTHHIE